MRRVSYLDEGLVGDEEDQDAPGYLSPFEREVAEADRAKLDRRRMSAVDPSIDPAGMQEGGRMPASSGMFSPQDYLSSMDQRQPMPPVYQKEYRGKEAPEEYSNFEVAPDNSDYLSNPNLDLIRPDTITGADTGDPDGEPQLKEAGTAFGTAPSPKSPIADRLSALDAYEKGLAERPTLEKPKWWQHALGGVLGGMAGWSNAASRTARPIDVTGAQEEIEHPGYKGKLAEWQSRVEPLKAVAEIEQQKVASQQAAQKNQVEATLKGAQAAAALQHGEYWKSRSEQERNQWKIDPKTGTLFNTITGEQVNKAATPKDRYEIAKALGATEDEAREYALNGKLSTPAPKNLNEWELRNAAANGDKAAQKVLADKAAEEIRIRNSTRDPLMDVIRREKLDQIQRGKLDDIGQRKTQNEAAVESRRLAAIAKALPGRTESEIYAGKDPNEIAKLQGINAEFAPQKQAIADTFTNAARGHKIDAPRFTVNPKTLQYEQVAEQPQQSDRVTVQIPGQPPGQIDRSKLDEFKKKYPNAKVQ